MVAVVATLGPDPERARWSWRRRGLGRSPKIGASSENIRKRNRFLLLSFAFRDRTFSIGYTRFKQEKIPPGAQPAHAPARALSTVEDVAWIPIFRKMILYRKKFAIDRNAAPTGRGVAPFIQPGG
jgi:hypothetical protein